MSTYDDGYCCGTCASLLASRKQDFLSLALVDSGGVHDPMAFDLLRTQKEMTHKQQCVLQSTLTSSQSP